MTIGPSTHCMGIEQLLTCLIDKLDNAQARGHQNAQTIVLNSKTWPALYEAARESDKEFLWEQLLQLTTHGWFQLTPAAAYSDSGYADNPRLKVLNQHAVRQALGRTERVKSASERWKEAVYTHLCADEETRKLVSTYCIDLAEYSMEDVVKQLNGVPQLANSVTGSPLLLREASAQLFWGMSKVLDQRTGLINALLKTDHCPFAEAPLQLQVYLPHHPFEQILFIENQTTFERAIRTPTAPFDGIALAFASGFKGSAARLRNRDHASLYFSPKGQLERSAIDTFEHWLFTKNTPKPTYFWGDLDWAGMRILLSLRDNFPEIEAWQPGYKPMLAALLKGLGHLPEAADKQGQIPLTRTACSYADQHLLPALNTYGKFIDQEQLGFLLG